MELALGTETREEYLAFELALAARKLVEQVMLTQPGENLVVTADTSTDWRAVEALAKAAYAAGATSSVVLYDTRLSTVIEPPAPVAGAVARADVWIELAFAPLLHTEAFKAALAAGCRYICLNGMDTTMLVNTVGRVNYPRLIDLGNALCATIASGDKFRVTSAGGSDLAGYLRGRKVLQSGRLATNKGEAIMLGGQISFAPEEETIEGRLVFDGALWPPIELGLLHNPVAVTVEKGVITTIEGGTEAKVFERWLKGQNHPRSYWLAHISLGFNPGVTRTTGRIVEDERVFGCLEVGFGSRSGAPGSRGETWMPWTAPSHTDGSIVAPTLYLDDVVIEREGVYVHPDLVRACRDLGVPGYQGG